MPLIGLAGGIGSGKSAVARAMADRGLWISDSDAAVREILTRPEVVAELRRWWGDRVLTPDGRIDRKAVAGIVFQDPDDRRRLEALIHPMVHEDRARLRAQAALAGAPGVVLDAPLLYEAGLERECDAVVFVDTPREIRLERVRATRGWDEAELDRREAAQLPVEEKRRRADAVVRNDSTPEALADRVRVVLDALLPRLQAGRPGASERASGSSDRG